MRTIRSTTKAPAQRTLKKNPVFKAQAFLDSAGVARKSFEYRRSDRIYTQGDPANNVYYIQNGGIRLSVKDGGEEVVVATLACGDFFGEECLTGQSVRTESATAIIRTILLAI